MSTAFHVLTGGRAGARFSPTGDGFIAGRHPDADLRFDPTHDAGVSGRHARFRRSSTGWTVQDLESRNGTFVNGRAAVGEVRLREGDRVMFGAGGPEVKLVPGAATDGSVTVRIRAAVRRERSRAAVVAITLLAIIVGLVGALAVVESRARSETSERALLERRIDSLIAQGRRSEASLAGEVEGLNLALKESERRLERLRVQLSTPDGTRGDTREELREGLRQELLAATAALRRQQLAASLDFDLIQRLARGAVAMLWVEYGDGERTTGTAFAVRPDGTLLTSRHLVSGPNGDRRPARMAVRFADSDQAFPARLVAASRDWDLALVRVQNLVGSVPVVPGFDTRPTRLPPGSPVALIGYPLGGEPEQDPAVVRRVARPVVSAGLVLRSADRGLEVQGLGAEGASGSPVLDGAGRVVGVLYGGASDGGVQVLLGVPAAAAARFVAAVP